MSPLLDYPLPWSAPPRGRVLVLAPHADDETIGCGGTIALHVAQGDPVAIAIATDGAAGDPDGRFAGQDYRALRRAEAVAAAEVLGAGRPEFWEFPDGALQGVLQKESDSLVDAVRRTLERIRPEIVYLPPETEVHADHHALAVATRRAV